jgi:hypothetical protein
MVYPIISPLQKVIMARAGGPHGLSHNLTSTVSDHGKGWGPHGLSHTPHNGVCVVRQEVRIPVPSKSIIAMSNTSVH